MVGLDSQGSHYPRGRAEGSGQENECGVTEVKGQRGGEHGGQDC
jgi:hypothetical protein